MQPVGPEQVIFLGIVAAVVFQLIKLYQARKGVVIDRTVLTVILFVISIPLAYIWARPALPAFPPWPAPVEDPSLYAGLIVAFLGEVIVFLGKLIAVLAAIIGFATSIYNILLEKVFEKLGWTKARVMAGAKVTDYGDRSEG